MTTPVISVEGVSKRFVLRHKHASHYETLRDTISAALRKQLRWLGSREVRRSPAVDYEEFWALRDVSFEVEPGERIGIIGRNGAGKSTLLKILSRITPPTAGRARIDGRVASLLEVGTGFHPELTGRENIFLNGSILGMTRAEIRRHFDEIVEFSDVAQFLDTPVKRYSSGMYVRLAFAVAAFLDPDVLIVDEVLAVGDAAFQQKCLSRLRDLEREARTVLFVSHNLPAISTLCGKVMVLEQGRVIYRLGPVPAGLDAYRASQRKLANVPLSERRDRQGRGRVRICSVRWYSGDNPKAGGAATGQPLTFEITVRKDVSGPINDVTIFLNVLGNDGGNLSVLTSETSGNVVLQREVQTWNCRIVRLPFNEGEYTVNVMIRSGGVIEDWIQDAAALSVDYGRFFKQDVSIPRSHSCVLFDQEWRMGQ